MKTALIIDDDERCRTPVASQLRTLGWHVVEAEGGEQGLELPLEHVPEVILCNLLMPRGNGFQLCRGVREQLDSRHTRIVAVSSGECRAEHKAPIEAGAGEVVQKSDLLGALNAIVARAAASLPDLAAGDG